MRVALAILLSAWAAVSLAAAPRKVAAARAPAKRPVPALRETVKKPAAPVQSAHRRVPYVGAIAAVESEAPVRKSDGTGANRRCWRVIFSENPEAEAYPASVTKLMTILLVLEDVRAGRYDFDDLVTATADVYRCEPSWVGIKVGETMTVRDLCRALMVESANDAAIALGVHAAGSFDAFVQRMNARAKDLGMEQTRYFNPNGLPPNATKRYPWKSFNVSTAADQLRLAQRLVTMPEIFGFTSVKTCDLIKTAEGFRVNVTRASNRPVAETKLQPGETVVKQMRNHNNILVKDKQKVFNPDGTEATDGLKTGYIDAGGSSIVLTGCRGGRRAIVVVLGSASSKERDEHAARLLSDALGAQSW